MTTKKNVLVTGGAGFIGSHVVDLLIEQGHQVTVIDNYSTGRPENLGHLKGNPQLTLVQADINDPKTAGYYQGIQWVIHLAALADIVPSIVHPLEYHHANVNGTIRVLEFSRAAGIERFLYSASSSCYGIPDEYPTQETAEIRCQYPYATTKNLGEQYVMNWGRIYKMPVVSVRFFNVYGTRSRTSGTYGAVFGVFLAQKLNNKPFTVVGDGNQSRDFTYVTDVARAVVAATASDTQNEIMNIGSGNHYTINQLVKYLEGPVTYIPKRPGEPDITFADTTKIQKLLGWKPQVSFEQGVKEVLKNIDYWRNAPVWSPDNIKEATKDWFKYLGERN